MDATHVPRELAGLRTLFNGFHHFRPLDATAILADAVRARQPIAIFEASRRSLAHVDPSALHAALRLAVHAIHATVHMEAPVVHLSVPARAVHLFVGWRRSQFRAYTIDELRELGRAAGSMEWRAGPRPFRAVRDN